jgi:hypothetical protein
VVLSPQHSSAALTAAGWRIQPASGMVPLAGGRQLAWFDTRSPAGDALSLQFLDSAKRARREFALATSGSPGFRGATIDNVLVFESPDGKTPLPGAVLSAVRSLLQRP